MEALCCRAEYPCLLFIEKARLACLLLFVAAASAKARPPCVSSHVGNELGEDFSVEGCPARQPLVDIMLALQKGDGVRAHVHLLKFEEGGRVIRIPQESHFVVLLDVFPRKRRGSGRGWRYKDEFVGVLVLEDFPVRVLLEFIQGRSPLPLSIWVALYGSSAGHRLASAYRSA